MAYSSKTLSFSRPLPFAKARPIQPGRFLEIYKKLRKVFGHQRWWPGDTPFEIMVGAILTQNTAWTNVEKAVLTEVSLSNG